MLLLWVNPSSAIALFIRSARREKRRGCSSPVVACFVSIPLWRLNGWTRGVGSATCLNHVLLNSSELMPSPTKSRNILTHDFLFVLASLNTSANSIYSVVGGVGVGPCALYRDPVSYAPIS